MGKSWDSRANRSTSNGRGKIAPPPTGRADSASATNATTLPLDAHRGAHRSYHKTNAAPDFSGRDMRWTSGRYPTRDEVTRQHRRMRWLSLASTK